MLYITDHACERYINRITGGTLSVESAREELEAAYESSRALKQRSTQGHSLREAEIPRACVLVIKPDDAGNGSVLVTVLSTREISESIDDIETLLADRNEANRRKESERSQLRPESHAEQIRVLSLELAIIKEEVALARIKIAALREATTEKYSGKNAALRWAIRALNNEVSVGEALSRIGVIGPHFLTRDYLDVEFEK